MSVNTTKIKYAMRTIWKTWNRKTTLKQTRVAGGDTCAPFFWSGGTLSEKKKEEGKNLKKKRKLRKTKGKKGEKRVEIIFS